MTADEMLFAKWFMIAFFCLPFAWRRASMSTWIAFLVPTWVLFQLTVLDVFLFWFVVWAVFVMILSFMGTFGERGSL